MQKVQIFTDGACSGNPGRGGWAYIIIDKQNNKITNKKSCSGACEMTTNNRMELFALIKSLENMGSYSSEVEFYSDSQYIINALTKGWLESWQKNNWKTSGKKPVANKDLWEKIINLTSKIKLKPIWVRGHDGHPENEECDKMAVAAYTSGPYEKDICYTESGKLF